MSKTSIGLEENIAGVLTYLLGFITGIIFLLIEKENKSVRFNAAQSIVVFGGLSILNTIVSMVPVLGGVISSLIGLVSLVLWFYLIYMTYTGNLVRLPVACEYADKIIAKDV
ncbi:DUF4870 domain-containing protein [Methanohalophilus portucalensis]|uniref:Uncharacterized membrane protein n=2 Tax=Methanohalophilus portucalensis TaxID=39664 RepID=A0A1L9C4X8_9EURY|nr:hypothetical protein [Methanohalophilus portucalensis]ATU08233.1 hypothetical protein BKM01_05290 [Methanohalophilus portucalensis]OJH49543.1 hypothetical protein MPF_0331 [Methanohalophilus portucalensis FDF-1]RNI13602.1 hypothetical protein EFE41_03235 [Methanohalophilus portucalensis FDF-1]SMH35568.1 Uncharacterized membrane protein [Methanohalophilus portucalensis FDF-1]